MAMDLGGAKGGVKSDINVTPLCDVMLVLLIIMMIVAPLLQQGVSVKLPVAANTVDKPETQGQTVVAIARDKSMYVNAKPVQEAEMATRINEILENAKEKVVFIRADEEVEYGAVMAAMDQLRQAGIEDIGLITDPKKNPGGSTGGK
jgi:biopolymer transport protein TolR